MDTVLFFVFFCFLGGRIFVLLLYKSWSVVLSRFHVRSEKGRNREKKRNRVDMEDEWEDEIIGHMNVCMCVYVCVCACIVRVGWRIVVAGQPVRLIPSYFQDRYDRTDVPYLGVNHNPIRNSAKKETDRQSFLSHVFFLSLSLSLSQYISLSLSLSQSHLYDLSLFLFVYFLFKTVIP